MVLERLELRDFRNYAALEFRPEPGLNLLVGPNGAGKSNLLEAVALACSGRSPRGAGDGELVRHGAAGYVVRATVRTRSGRHVLALAGGPGGRRLRIDGGDALLRDLLGLAPVVWFGPDDLALVKGAPAARRRFLDLLAAQLQPVHAADMLAYGRILAQRNGLLRQLRARPGGGGPADLFDEALLRTGARIVRRRLEVLRDLQPLAAGAHAQLAGEAARLELRYVAGDEVWEPEPPADLEERLRAALLRRAAEELRRGQTLWGPQRDDVRLLLAGRDARGFASQGQQRAIVLALKWGEWALLEARLGEPPLLLLDDVFSELDRPRALALAGLATRVPQALVTAATPPEAATAAAARFRVEGGRVWREVG